MVGVGDPCCRICLSGRILPWPAVMGSGWGQCRAPSLALPPTPCAGLSHSGELRALGPVRTRVLVSAERLSGACGPAAACTGRPCEQVDCGTQCPLAPCMLPRLTETAPLPLLLMRVCWPFLTVGSSCRGPCSPWCILVDSGGRAHAMSDMQPDPEWFFSLPGARAWERPGPGGSHGPGPPDAQQAEPAGGGVQASALRCVCGGALLIHHRRPAEEPADVGGAHPGGPPCAFGLCPPSCPPKTQFFKAPEKKAECFTIVHAWYQNFLPEG